MGEKEAVFPCDLCGCEDAVEVPFVRDYTGGQLYHICMNCGLIYTKKRRSYKEVADCWSNELYGDPSVLLPSSYSALNPHVKARQTYVVEFTNNHLSLEDKKLCDIGAGEGQFIQYAHMLGAEVFGVEPSDKNNITIKEKGFNSFNGTSEDFASHVRSADETIAFDIVTIMWTLECSQSPAKVLKTSYDILNQGGYIVIATGSRILVPFKKPLHKFLSTNPLDTHPVHFSYNTLNGMLASNGFEIEYENPWIENDILCVAARKTGKKDIPWEKDDYLKVADFFERWHRDSLYYR